MRLLVVLPAYEPAYAIGGGVTYSMVTLCRAIVNRGVPITVYTTNVNGGNVPLDVPLREPIDIGGVSVCYFKSTFGPKSMFYSADLVRQMRSTVHEFDVVYITGFFMWTGIKAVRICRKNRVPVIAGIHGGFTYKARQKSRLKKIIFRQLFIKNAINSVAAIHLTSHFEQINSAGWLNGRPVFVIPNPVDPETLSPCRDKRKEFRSKYNIPLDAPVLIAATRFDWMKRIDLLIEAMAKLPHWRLVVVGDFASGTGPRLMEYARSVAVSDRITWTGYLERKDLCVAMSASDIFALVSETENFGNVAVEAMMCGLPVLVSKETGVCEFINDQPFVMTPGLSAESIVDSLQSYERDRSTSRFDSARIRQVAIDRFSPSVIAERFVNEVSVFTGSDVA
jgi:glycosyltransferase involved in cell wall biosynthesis